MVDDLDAVSVDAESRGKCFHRRLQIEDWKDEVNLGSQLAFLRSNENRIKLFVLLFHPFMPWSSRSGCCCLFLFLFLYFSEDREREEIYWIFNYPISNTSRRTI